MKLNQGIYRLSLIILLGIFIVCYFQPSFNFNHSVIDSFSSLETANIFVQSDNTNFGDFNNETGVNYLLIPNILHYVRLNKKSWSFVEYICLLSAFKNQRPNIVFIHTNIISGFQGKYWKWIQQINELKSILVILKVDVPAAIFGQKLNPDYKTYHASDLIRIQILMKYGGIFLDNDVYVVHNLDKYRKFEMTLGWPDNESLGTMVLIAHKSARFLPLWLENYHDYKGNQWYYNAGDNPTVKVLSHHPKLVHREKTRLGTTFMMREVFQEKKQFMWYDELDCVHLLINHRRYLDMFYKDYRYFNERNILHYPFNFGEMALRVLFKV